MTLAVQETVQEEHALNVEALMKQPGKQQSRLAKAASMKMKMPRGKKRNTLQDAWSRMENAGPFTTTPRQHQMKLTTSSPDPQAVLNADMAVADWIHCRGHAHQESEDPKFRHMLSLMKYVPIGYVTPSRNRIAGDLLNTNYNRVTASADESLLLDANIYGLQAYGDAATVHKVPFVNILASSPNNPAVVLEIANCKEQMEDGGAKDAEYIASMFLPHMDRLDPDGTLFDLLKEDELSDGGEEVGCEL